MNRRAFLYSMLGSAFATSSPSLAQDARIKIAFLGGSHSHAKDKVKVVQDPLTTNWSVCSRKTCTYGSLTSSRV
jgi:hypothetical protein